MSVFAIACQVACAQPQSLLIDRVIAVVGREPILHSELVVKVEQARQQEGAMSERDLACSQLEDLLYEKLLVEQGHLDSVVVQEDQVNAELDRRIRYFAAQLGGEKKLEEFYGKTIAEIKSDFRPQVHDQLLVQSMQQISTSSTPRFFISLRICIQNLVPSAAPTQMPRTSLRPSSLTPSMM